MAKQKKNNGEVPGSGDEGSGSMNFNLTPEHRQAIMAIVYNTEKTKLDKEAIKDDVAALAAKIGCKPTDVNGMVSVIIQEREKPGVIEAREKSLELARQVLDGQDVSRKPSDGEEDTSR